MVYGCCCVLVAELSICGERSHVPCEVQNIYYQARAIQLRCVRTGPDAPEQGLPRTLYCGGDLLIKNLVTGGTRTLDPYSLGQNGGEGNSILVEMSLDHLQMVSKGPMYPSGQGLIVNFHILL